MTEKLWITVFLGIFHSFRVLSSLPEMRKVSSEAMSIDLTGPECPWNSWVTCPVMRSHILIELSVLPETRNSLLREIATEFTAPECPCRTCVLLLVKCQTITL